MRTLNNAELAFLAMLGHAELTTRVLRVYAAHSYLFTETFHPHLNLMWNRYVELLKEHRGECGLHLRADVAAAGLAEAVASSRILPDELKQKCDDILQKLVAGDVPDIEQGGMLIRNLMKLDTNRRLVTQLNMNPELAALQQSLDASRRTMSLMDDEQPDPEDAGVVVKPLKDIRRLARKTVRIPTGINFMDELSSGGGRAGDLWLVLGAPASGKCLAPETGVLMYDGTVKTAGEIVEGDLLMGPDSKPRKVLSTVSGSGPMYTVSYKHGIPFKCNGSHLLTVTAAPYPGRTARLHGEPIRTGCLYEVSVDEYLSLGPRARDLLRMVRASVDFHRKCRRFPLDPYFAGLCAGSPSTLQNNIYVPDGDVADYCEAMGCELGFEVRREPSGWAQAHVVFRPSDGRSLRRTLSECMVRDGLLRAPDFVKYGSRRTREQFLAGIADSCGQICRGSLHIEMSNAGLVDDIAFIARSVGLPACVCDARKHLHGTSMHIVVGGQVGRLPVLSRKGLSRRPYERSQSFRFSVEPAGDGGYSGFMVSGDGRFLLSDFTVTHNSTLTVQMCCAQAILGNDVMWATYEQSVEGDLAERMIANITDTSLDSIRDVGFDNLDKDIQDKFWAATAGVGDHLTAMDMTRITPDPQDPSDYGGVASIWKQFKKQKEAGAHPKIVIIDWFGAMMTRIAANLGIDLSACYRFKAQEEINTLIKFAREERVQIMVMHQLDVKAAAARPTFLADATHAQDMHNMQNFFDLVIILGNKDVNGIMYMSNPKARKGGRVVRTVHMIGDKSRMMMEEGWLPNKDGNFYKPGSAQGGLEAGGFAVDYSRELD